MAGIRVLLWGVLLVGGARGHLLPQALEDVHRFVQTEINRRSQGGAAVREEGGPPPGGGAAFQTTQTFIGTPIVLQKEVRLDGEGGIQMPGFPIHGDLETAGSTNIALAIEGASRRQGGIPPPPAMGLVPPVPLQLSMGDQQVQGSVAVARPAVVQANVVGPSTFVSEVPLNQGPPLQQQVQQSVQVAQIETGEGKRGMEGWVPLGADGARLAKGVGVKVQVEEDLKNVAGSQVDYQDTGYTLQKQEGEVRNNELEIIPTNSVKLGATAAENVILGGSNRLAGAKRYPIYPGVSGGSGGNAKVVIHAQNVIIRGGPDGESVIEEVTNGTTSGNPAVKQYPAYQGVPQLNTFLRDQLRMAAMNQLLSSALLSEQPHPLQDKPFPRPLSLREIAAAVRNGQFPQPTREQLQGLSDSIPSPSNIISPSHLQVSIPHMVKMRGGGGPRPEQLTLPSLQSSNKLLLPGGLGLGNLYKNLFQQDLSSGGYDPREALEYSLLAQITANRAKHGGISPHKPASTSDYGDSVKYQIDEGKQKEEAPYKDPIQIVPAQPLLSGALLKPASPLALLPHTGNLRDTSDHVLKQLLLQELQETEGDQPQLLLSGQGHHSLRRPVRPSKPSYGTNAHPFAFLATEGGHQGPPGYEETYEYTLPPGTSIDDYLNDDGGSLGLKGRPHGPRPGYGSHGGSAEEGDQELMPLNKDTLVSLGKTALRSALEFSRNHNPLTFIQRVRSLPPVKVDLYKVPMGIPDSLMNNLPEKWRGGGGGGGGHGGGGGDEYGPPPPRHLRRSRKKHQPRKNNKYH